MSKRGLTAPQSFHTLAGALLIIAIAVATYLYFYSDKMHFGEESQNSELTYEQKQQVLDAVVRSSTEGTDGSQNISATEKTKQLNQVSQSGNPSSDAEKIDEQTKIRILESLNAQ